MSKDVSKGLQNWSETVKKGFETLEKWIENFGKMSWNKKLLKEIRKLFFKVKNRHASSNKNVKMDTLK